MILSKKYELMFPRIQLPYNNNFYKKNYCILKKMDDNEHRNIQYNDYKHSSPLKFSNS